MAEEALPTPTVTRAAETRGPLVVTLVVKERSGGTGIGRYADELEVRLLAAGVQVQRVGPIVPSWLMPVVWVLRRAGLDLAAFLDNYPLFLDRRPVGMVHLTSQSMGTLLWRYRFDLVVVTVHDILPYLLRNTPGLRMYHHPIDAMFDRLAMAGLRRADALIADSTYTRDEVIRLLAIPPGHIQVIELGVG